MIEKLYVTQPKTLIRYIYNVVTFHNEVFHVGYLYSIMFVMVTKIHNFEKGTQQNNKEGSGHTGIQA